MRTDQQIEKPANAGFSPAHRLVRRRRKSPFRGLPFAPWHTVVAVCASRPSSGDRELLSPSAHPPLRPVRSPTCRLCARPLHTLRPLHEAPRTFKGANDATRRRASRCACQCCCQKASGDQRTNSWDGQYSKTGEQSNATADYRTDAGARSCFGFGLRSRGIDRRITPVGMLVGDHADLKVRPSDRQPLPNR